MNGTTTSFSASTAATSAWHPSAREEARLNLQLTGVEQALDNVVRGSGRAGDNSAHETRDQQQAREAADAKVTCQKQLAREAKELEATLQAQKEREAREHGLAPPGAPTGATATGTATPLDGGSGISQDSLAAANVSGIQAGLLSSRSSRSSGSSGMSGMSGISASSALWPAASADATSALPAAGADGEGTHPLRPVPQNGGERSEAPTTVADINAIINDIDPTLLTDPSQKGEGQLKGLPYGKMFEAAGKATGINPAILYADSQVETGDNKNGRILVPNNINPIQTAPGVWPTTKNAATNLFTGAYVMKDYINRADGDLKRGLNAYNTGNLAPEETGFADGYAGYYEGVMAALGNVEKAIKDSSIIEPGQGGNVSVASQI